METDNKQQEKKVESSQMKNKGFIIKGTVYPFDVHVFVGDDLKKCHKFIKSFVPKSAREEILPKFNGDYSGYTLQGKNGSIIIHYVRIPELGLMCHEAFHVVEFIFDHIGIKHTKSTSEAYAYYLGYIVEELLKNIYD